ncbi:biopolymer transporter ExbD [Acuticoccus sp. M5D2P5]|uniref:biopolymer transporter ExbD n=1 Tax=Acuticoccus kalidii TaxID=2910977 RepID=UPI001F1F9825|nr:biopolymer transporter ExbD [Acuticoccus kalidii]MCF3935781.1 biopolymer transporter ExbD [Acuticoccus kalidii]
MARKRHNPLAVRPRRRDAGESTIPLINVVFLLLVFFLVAGTLSAPRDEEVELATAEEFTPSGLQADALYIAADGSVRVGGAVMETRAAIEAIGAIHEESGEPLVEIAVIPDRNLDAPALLDLLAEVRTITEIPLRIVVRRPMGGESGE